MISTTKVLLICLIFGIVKGVIKRCHFFPDHRSNCEILPGIPGDFQENCPIRVCIDKNVITYEGTNQDGQYEITSNTINKSTIKQNFTNISTEFHDKLNYRSKLEELEDLVYMIENSVDSHRYRRSLYGRDYTDSEEAALGMIRRMQTRQGGDQKYTHNIFKQCYDTTTSKVYDLGATWINPNKCQLLSCAYLTNIRTVHFAIVKEINCMDIPDRTSDCRFLPATTVDQFPFPNCCIMKVCIKSNVVNITKTSMSGDLIQTMREINNAFDGANKTHPDHRLQLQKMKSECTDPTNPENTYYLGETWPIEGQCQMYYCDNITLEATRNNPFAVANKLQCVNVTSRETDCEILPETSNGTFPDCCPMKICITGNMVKFSMTTALGDLEEIHRSMKKPKKSVEGFFNQLPAGLKPNQIVKMHPIFKWPGFGNDTSSEEVTTNSDSSTSSGVSSTPVGSATTVATTTKPF